MINNINRKDIIWNILGTITYSLCSLFLSIIIINILGKDIGGIFSFGFSTLAHIVFVIGYFGIRPLHIVDIKYKYSFNEYINFGKITFLTGIIFGLSYILILFFLGKYNIEKFIILLFLIIHGAINGYLDFYECEFQRVNKLYIAGQSLFFRTIVFILVLIISLVFTKNLILAEFLSILAEILFSFIFIKNNKFKFINDGSIDKKNIVNLFKESLPLFLIVFFDMFIFASSKIAIDINLTDEFSGIFNLLFMPTNAIFLVVNLFMKPLLTSLSKAFHSNEKNYNYMLIKTIFYFVIFSIILIIGCILFNYVYIDILNVFTNNLFSDYYSISKILLIYIIIGGCLYSINTPIYYSLIIENKQQKLLLPYILAFIVSILSSEILVIKYGIIGTGIAFMLNMFCLCLFIIITKVYIKNVERK